MQSINLPRHVIEEKNRKRPSLRTAVKDARRTIPVEIRSRFPLAAA
jgi:hypothetical protein